ncbi:MAG: response regulator [Kiritimatiellaeota bacterium]|nr:response regulator [Kiritimatiellota bacterium]
MSASHKHVLLLVDDDPSLLNTLRDFLAFEGFEVVTAPSGEKALVELRGTRPDLILLDMSMPGMGGVGFLERITNLDGTTAYPVLVLTARAMMAEYFADKQIDGFMAKPCDPADLLQEINRIIYLRGGAANTPPAHDTHGARRVVLGEAKEAFSGTLREAFAKFNVQVEAAATGPAVVEAAVTTRPDAVVMRLALPGMTAGEVASMLRRLPTTAAAPVIVYGTEAPDAQPADTSAPGLESATLLRDVSIDKIISATLEATGGGK